jgi:hypothetical protein
LTAGTGLPICWSVEERHSARDDPIGRHRHAAAKLLGIDIATLEKKLADHGLDGRN